jgi:hypothetical protein
MKSARVFDVLKKRVEAQGAELVNKARPAVTAAGSADRGVGDR